MLHIVLSSYLAVWTRTNPYLVTSTALEALLIGFHHPATDGRIEADPNKRRFCICHNPDLFGVFVGHFLSIAELPPEPLVVSGEQAAGDLHHILLGRGAAFGALGIVRVLPYQLGIDSALEMIDA